MIGLFIPLSCSSNKTIVGKHVHVLIWFCTAHKSRCMHSHLNTHSPVQMHLSDKHIQFSVHLIVHSVSIEANSQVRSSCGPCSAEFCCRPLISLTLLLPKTERAIKRERPFSQRCQDMPLQFTGGGIAGKRERDGRVRGLPLFPYRWKIIQIVRDLISLSD